MPNYLEEQNTTIDILVRREVRQEERDTAVKVTELEVRDKEQSEDSGLTAMRLG